MVAAAAMLTVSAVLSPKKQVKHVEKLETMWRTANGSKGKGNKRVQTVLSKDANIVNTGSNIGARATSEVLRVLRSDAKFIGTATAPIRKAIGDFFWLRFLEKEPVPEPKQKDDAVTPPPKSEFPVLSPYSPGMICPYYENRYLLTINSITQVRCLADLFCRFMLWKLVRIFSFILMLFLN
jgi:hypothetical protein